MGRIALCADAESIREPGLIGLSGENLVAQSWLKLFSNGQKARLYLKGADDVSEVWVTSCADVDAVNLAATLKADNPDCKVILLSGEKGGSVRSCATKAGIDQVVDQAEFARRYALHKSGDSMEAASRLLESFPSGMSDVRRRGQEAGPEKNAEALALPSKMPDLRGLDRPTATGRAFLLPVLSGSGGAGKSTIAVMMATLLQQVGIQTLLIDFDLQFGDVECLAGRSDALGIDDLLRYPMRVSQLAPKGGLPAVLKVPARLEDAELLAQRIPEIVSIVQGQFDVIVANTGAFWTEIHAQLLERSTKAVFLIDQRPSSLRSCKRALDLCARCGIAASPFVFAPNRCSKNALYTSIDISCALHGADSYELAEGGPEVEEALAEGQPLDLCLAANPLVKSIDQLLCEIVPGYRDALDKAGDSDRRQGLLQRLGIVRKKPTREVIDDVVEGEGA